MNTPSDLKYTESHEWIRIEGNQATIGITDHAQNELSDVVFVEFPDVGKKLEAKDTVATVESVKAASDIYTPVSGEVTEVNADLENDPGLINTSPYEKGWIYRMTVADSSQLEGLLSAEDYAGQTGS